jgi:hypothetical protein
MIQNVEISVPMRHHAGAEEMHQRPHLVGAKQHHAQKAGLEKEGGQHLVAEQRPEDGAGLLGQARPVGAELKAHHDARHHAHAEGDGEHLAPELVQVPPDVVARAQPAPFQKPASLPGRW